ncbi:MAG TPA: hypothetical protein DEO43_03445 [Halieaceae bacterium]|nr:hypothetical protein [Halieaceae bacterium]
MTCFSRSLGRDARYFLLVCYFFDARYSQPYSGWSLSYCGLLLLLMCFARSAHRSTVAPPAPSSIAVTKVGAYSLLTEMSALTEGCVMQTVGH